MAYLKNSETHRLMGDSVVDLVQNRRYKRRLICGYSGVIWLSPLSNT